MPDMNVASTPENVVWKLVDPKTGAENMNIRWHFKQGDVTKIELFNDPGSGQHPMQHPIHFHGQRFLVLDVNGETNPNLHWKDTVLVRPGERVQILLDNDNPGKWMFHCHILRHGLDGPVMRMMGYFDVESRTAGRV